MYKIVEYIYMLHYVTKTINHCLTSGFAADLPNSTERVPGCLLSPAKHEAPQQRHWNPMKNEEVWHEMA